MPANDDGQQRPEFERHPGLSADGRRMLDQLREHPSAPIFRNESGHRLLPAEIEGVRSHERAVLAAELRARRPGELPGWLDGFVDRCFEQVPHWRRLGRRSTRFADLPTSDRGLLGADIAAFVPDDISTERMINYRTSGTTGHPLLIASHPVVAAKYLAFHRRALRRFGIELRHGRGQVGVILLGYQRVCFTYVSVTPTQDECGLAKINLHPGDWRDQDDRVRYLDAMGAEVLAGDPLSFAVLLELPVTHRPRALLCTSMTLLPGLRLRLEERFGCPVLDLYSMNEAGPIAVADPGVGGHVLLQPEMHVEILDPAGGAVADGVRGEITLTGGFNFCLPLLRYRTGDFAAMRSVRGEPVLIDLEGRPPVRFRTGAGEWVNNIEVTHALRPFPVGRFQLHQDERGAFRFGYGRSGVNRSVLEQALRRVLGDAADLRVEETGDEEGKRVQYTSELEGALP